MKSERTLSIKRLSSGGIIANYYCSSSCRHCLYRCSPKWPKEYISAQTARENFETVRKLGCRSVHVGGGEPLLRPEGVALVLEAARETGVSVEYLETNSSWYKNHEDACGLLEKLAGLGLRTLLVSISPFHNEQIPFSKVMGVLDACRGTGIAVFPWIAEFVPDMKALGQEETHTLEEYEHVFGSDYIKNLPSRYWISSGGRALETFGKYSRQRSIEDILSENSSGCAELAQVGHFHLDLHGNYVPGLCAGLSIFRDDLGVSLAPEEYPMISRLYSGGVGAFLSYASQQHGFSASRKKYGLKCELCYEIRRFLVVDKGIRSRELQPLGHYLGNS